MRGEPEKIQCSALYIDLPLVNKCRGSYEMQETGMIFPVVTGYRHNDCFWTLYMLVTEVFGLPKEKFAELRDHCEQGFMTTKGRFVSREEAYKIAVENNQCSEETIVSGVLYSEDLY